MMRRSRTTIINGFASTEQKATQSCRNGFTLIEMSVVVTLMALIFGMAALQLRDPYQKAKLQVALERTVLFDSQIREFVRRNQSAAVLTIELMTGRFIVSGLYGHQTESGYLQLELGAEIKIERVITKSESVRYGNAMIGYSDLGQSESFAIKISNPGGDARWIVFAGLTGDAVIIEDEDESEAEIERLFQMLSA